MKTTNFFIILGLGALLFSCKKQKEPLQKATIAKSSVQSTTIKNKPVTGIDVSHFQGEIKWKDAKNLSFAYAKASEGMYFKDPMFATNRKGTKAANIPFGAYHFYVAQDNVVQQIENFITAVQKLNKGNMPPMLDLEQGGMKPETSVDSYQKNVLHWLESVEEKLGVSPIIYTNTPFANQYLNNEKFSKYKLWIAEYTHANAPTIPSIWKNKGWLIWQKSEQGIEPLISKDDFDKDLFNGTIADLNKLLVN